MIFPGWPGAAAAHPRKAQGCHEEAREECTEEKKALFPARCTYVGTRRVKVLVRREPAQILFPLLERISHSRLI